MPSALADHDVPEGRRVAGAHRERFFNGGRGNRDRSKDCYHSAQVNECDVRRMQPEVPGFCGSNRRHYDACRRSNRKKHA